MRRMILLVVVVTLGLVLVAQPAAGAPPRALAYTVTCGEDQFKVTGIGTPQGWPEFGPPVLLMGGHFERTVDGDTTEWDVAVPPGLLSRVVECSIEGPTDTGAGFHIVIYPAYLMFVR